MPPSTTQSKQTQHPPQLPQSSSSLPSTQTQYVHAKCSPYPPPFLLPLYTVNIDINEKRLYSLPSTARSRLHRSLLRKRQTRPKQLRRLAHPHCRKLC